MVAAGSRSEGAEDCGIGTTSSTRRIIAVGLVTAALAAAIGAILVVTAAHQAPVSKPSFVRSYSGRVLHDGLEIRIMQGDGQAFAELARDPSLSRPEEFPTAGEAAYREQRPLLGYLAWAGSLGRSGWVPPALAVLFVVAVGLAAAGLAALLRQRGCSQWWATGLLLLPGTYAALTHFGPEILGLALVVWGYRAWTHQPRRAVRAFVLFAAAGLARETMLLVPGALVLVAIGRRRPRDVLLLSASAMPWIVWVIVVHARTGAWPTDAGEGRLSFPFTGLTQALTQGSIATIIPYALVGGAIAIGVIVFTRETALRAIVGAHAAFATLLGRFVWLDWQFYSRVLLPMYVFGFVALLASAIGDDHVTAPGPGPSASR